MSLILNQYDESAGDYQRLAQSIESLVGQIIKSINIDEVRITSRVKDRSSLSDKLDRPDKFDKYKTLTDITDICGIRVTTFTQEVAQTVVEELRKHFIIDEENSVDKSKQQEDDRFGYRSTHLVVSLRKNRCGLIENFGLSGLKAEIQVRTVLQDAWASLDWKLRYKSKVEVPREIRRKLYRISALLEAADDAFSDINSIVHDLRESYSEKIDEKNNEIPINRESLSLYIEKSARFSDLSSKMTASGVRFDKSISINSDSPWTYLINSLETAGISTLSQLDERLDMVGDAEIDTLKTIIEDWSSGSSILQLGVFSTIRILIYSTFSVDERRAFLDNYTTSGGVGVAERKWLLS